MNQVPGTRVAHLTYRFRNDVRLSYGFVEDVPIVRARDASKEELARFYEVRASTRPSADPFSIPIPSRCSAWDLRPTTRFLYSNPGRMKLGSKKWDMNRHSHSFSVRKWKRRNACRMRFRLAQATERMQLGGDKGMNREQFAEEGKLIYARFAAHVAKRLGTAIDESDEGLTQPQKIQHRAKSVRSLSTKLSDRGLANSQDIAAEIKDLAGCRVIFHQNDDVNQFSRSRIISDLFHVDWDESKFHHPDEESESANDFYMANHYVVSLKQEDIENPEFGEFDGLRCEIQVQTLLNHAWSETVHDITYKRRVSEGFGERLMSEIDDRLLRIMTDYLRPAGYEFQKVQHDYNVLLKGSDLAGRNIREELDKAESRAEVVGILDAYKTNVIPHLSDHASQAPEIFKIVATARALARSLSLSDSDESDLFWEPKNVLTECLELVSYVRYLDLERTMRFFIDLYSEPEHAEYEELDKHLERFAEYDFNVVNKNGLVVQLFLTDQLLAMSDEELKQFGGGAVTICKCILQPSFEKTDWTHDTVKIGRINLRGDQTLRDLRVRTLEILEKLLAIGDPELYLKTKSALEVATRTPQIGDYDDELLDIVLSNTNTVAEMYAAEADSQSLENRERTEEWLQRLYQRHRQLATDDRKPETLRQTVVSGVRAFEAYRDKLNSDADYVRFKTLVGFRSVLIEEWEEGSWNIKAKQSYRDAKTKEYIQEIDDGNLDQWIRFLGLCVMADSSYMATFRQFTQFLRLFANEKPDLASRLLDEENVGISRFLVAFLLGFAQANRRDLFDEKVDACIAAKENLWECARAFSLHPDFDSQKLTEIYRANREKENVAVLYQLVGAVVARGASIGNALTELLIPILEDLARLEDTGWIHEVWYRDELKEVLGLVSEEQSRLIINGLVPLKQIDFHAEQVLKPIADRFPSVVIDFFSDRRAYERSYDNEDRHARDRYEFLPYSFEQIHNGLSEIPDEVVDRVFEWYEEDGYMFQFGGASFIKLVFPEFGDRLEEKLIQKVSEGDDQSLSFVFAILRNYHGERFLHNVCKAIVRSECDDQFVNEVKIVLQESETLTGELGFVELCEARKREIEDWLDDDDPKVVEFTQSYIKGLDRQKAAELKRVEEEIEMRKHLYGE